MHISKGCHTGGRYRILIIVILTVMSGRSMAQSQVDDRNSMQTLSINVTNASLMQVLATLTKSVGLSLVVGDDIQGNVSLNLENVRFQNAIDMVLKSKGLSYELKDKVLMVLPADKYATYSQKQSEAMAHEQSQKPLLTEIIAIQFASANELQQVLMAQQGNLLSARASITADVRTNSLIVTEVDEKFLTLRKLIEKLDVPVEQVEIQARLVTVRDTLDEQFGIRWGSTGLSENGQRIGQWQGNLDAAADSAGISNYNINLPLADPAGQLAMRWSNLSGSRTLDLELSALERENKGEIVATPRITASNQHMAKIEQGTEIPYLQAAGYGATSISFKKAVLSLEVIPQITPDRYIVLDLNITQDARGESIMTSTGPAVAVDTQQVKTKVTVANGETLVLGGIYQQQLIRTTTKVPWLGDLPWLGWLFRSTSDYIEKRELLIFVTPSIVNSALSTVSLD